MVENTRSEPVVSEGSTFYDFPSVSTTLFFYLNAVVMATETHDYSHDDGRTV